MTVRKFRETVKNTKQFLLNSSVSFFGNDRYSDYFDSNENISLEDDVYEMVKQYHSLDIWEKIWWYLTTPISQYLVFNDILALKEMENATIEESVALYDYHHLGQHAGLIDWIVNNLRYELDLELEKVKKTNPPDEMTRLKINDMKIAKMHVKLQSMSARMTILEGEVKHLFNNSKGLCV